MPPVTMLIPLSTLEAAKIAGTLKSMFSGPKTGRPFIEADAESNSLRIRGSIEQVDEIKAVLAPLDRGGAGGTLPGNVRIITLEKGGAATVAEAVQLLFSKLQPNPVKLILPGTLDAEPAAPKKPAPEKKDAKPGKVAAPITITAFGNRLIVTSEDSEALEIVVQMVRILLNSQAAVCDIEIIRLKHARAVDFARIVNEAFNETKGQPPIERVRVIADPHTNSLLLRAAPIDTMVIRRLLQKLDVPASDVVPRIEGRKDRSK